MSQRFKLIDFVWVNDELGIIICDESESPWKFRLIMLHDKTNYTSGFGGFVHSYSKNVSAFDKYPRITEAELAILRLNGRISAKIYEEISAFKTQRH